MPAADFLGDFYGNAMKASELDAFIAKHVKHTDFRPASYQAETRWFGYRDLHPGTALFWYMDTYGRVFRDRAVKDFGMRGVTRAASAFKWRNMNKGTVHSFWSGMCHADMYGIPYDFYIRFFFDAAEREGWNLAPMPQQLYAARLVPECKAAFELFSEETFVKTANPIYKLSNYKDHKWQNEYQSFLLKSAHKRDNVARALAAIMIKEPMVTPKNAAKDLGIYAVRDALALAKS